MKLAGPSTLRSPPLPPRAFPEACHRAQAPPFTLTSLTFPFMELPGKNSVPQSLPKLTKLPTLSHFPLDPCLKFLPQNSHLKEEVGRWRRDET